jgi:hypothetical protein
VVKVYWGGRLKTGLAALALCTAALASCVAQAGVARAATAVIASEQTVRVSTTEAAAQAVLDGGGEPVTYRVEYGRSESYGQQSAEYTTLSAVTQTVTLQLEGLEPASEYHWRIVAEREGVTEAGADQTFTTLAGLPDGRVWELVSPPENNDANVGGRFASIAAADGDSVTYGGEATTGGNGLAFGNEYLATRLPRGGWSQANISPAEGNPKAQYQAFTSNLTMGFISIPTLPPYIVSEKPRGSALHLEGEEAQSGVLYTRAFAESDYRPLYTVVPFESNILKAERNRGGLNGGSGSLEFGIDEENMAVYAGSAEDGSHVLFEANVALLEGEGALEAELRGTVVREVQEIDEAYTLHKEGKESAALEALDDRAELYMSVDGQLGLVNVSAEGKLVPGATFGGPPASPGAYSVVSKEHMPDFSHAISMDGARVFWTSVEYAPFGAAHMEARPKAIYVREDGSRTVQVSSGPAQFWTASSGGRFAYYTEAGQLWRFDVESETREELAGGKGGVVSVIATNETGEEGAYVYFIDTEVLQAGNNVAGQAPVGGADNLYLLGPDRESPGGHALRFIGALSSGDYRDWTTGLGEREAQATPDGHALVFSTTQNLTGHAYGDEGDEEAYVFNAADGSLFCASCRAQASGGGLPTSNELTYTIRTISEDGDQVFFSSYAPLVAEDVNGMSDVYEWEREGSGSCEEVEGCVYLLSDGVGGSAGLLDAGANGGDVFFTTSQWLVPEDQNELTHLYDARVDGVPPARHEECSGTECQGPPAPPPPFAAPSTIAFEGPGNLPASGPVASSTKEVKSGKAKAKSRKAKPRQCMTRDAHRHPRCVKSRVKHKPSHSHEHKTGATARDRRSRR